MTLVIQEYSQEDSQEYEESPQEYEEEEESSQEYEEEESPQEYEEEESPQENLQENLQQESQEEKLDSQLDPLHIYTDPIKYGPIKWTKEMFLIINKIGPGEYRIIYINNFFNKVVTLLSIETDNDDVKKMKDHKGFIKTLYDKIQELKSKIVTYNIEQNIINNILNNITEVYNPKLIELYGEEIS